MLLAAEKEAQKEADHSLEARQSISGKGDYNKAINSAAVSGFDCSDIVQASSISCSDQLLHVDICFSQQSNMVHT
jgi:hypothetical protein